MGETARWKAVQKQMGERRRNDNAALAGFYLLRPDQQAYANHIGRSQGSPPLHKVIEKTLRNRP